MKYKIKSVIATQWFKNGDHPQDDIFRRFEDTGIKPTKPREGKVVRYYRHPHVNGLETCSHCGICFNNHGWIDTPNNGYTICPGDWIVNQNGKYYPCNPNVFMNIYEKCKDQRKLSTKALQQRLNHAHKKIKPGYYVHPKTLGLYFFEHIVLDSDDLTCRVIYRQLGTNLLFSRHFEEFVQKDRFLYCGLTTEICLKIVKEELEKRRALHKTRKTPTNRQVSRQTNKTSRTIATRRNKR
jgi:hypothetical protein